MEKKKVTEDFWMAGHSQPQLGHRGTCAVEIDNAVDGGIDTKPDKVPNGDNIGEGLPQLVTGLLLNEEVAGVEDDLEGGAAGLLLPPVAQDSSRQTVVLVHNPEDNDGEYFGNVSLNGQNMIQTCQIFIIFLDYQKIILRSGPN